MTENSYLRFTLSNDSFPPNASFVATASFSTRAYQIILFLSTLPA